MEASVTANNHSSEEADQIARSKKKMKRLNNTEDIEVDDMEDEENGRFYARRCSSKTR